MRGARTHARPHAHVQRNPYYESRLPGDGGDGISSEGLPTVFQGDTERDTNGFPDGCDSVAASCGDCPAMGAMKRRGDGEHSGDGERPVQSARCSNST
jgi:hypothetical protein